MHYIMPHWMSFLSITSLVSAGLIAKRASPDPSLHQHLERSVQQGWSLQAASGPAGTTSCGGGSYCPSSLHCNPAANDEVAACCPTGELYSDWHSLLITKCYVAADCRGSVESGGACADSSWSLWQGLNGNDFCCQVGLVGIYDYHNPVAGTCVSSAAAASATSAALVSSLHIALQGFIRLRNFDMAANLKIQRSLGNGASATTVPTSAPATTTTSATSAPGKLSYTQSPVTL